ncbi:hypothetical protein TNCV_4603471 [Trichonephila clavipes]|nr:hypothetical protein TNCV_4603471 [Trichonephila clavipes]
MEIEDPVLAQVKPVPIASPALPRNSPAQAETTSWHGGYEGLQQINRTFQKHIWWEEVAEDSEALQNQSSDVSFSFKFGTKKEKMSYIFLATNITITGR